MPFQSNNRINRVDVATRASGPFLAASTGAKNLQAEWRGFRLERWSVVNPLVMQDTSLSQHVVVLNVDAPIDGYIKFDGERGKQQHSVKGMVGITPANHSYSVDMGTAEVIALGIDPAYLADLGLARHRQVSIPPNLLSDFPLLRESLLALAADVVAGRPFGDVYGESIGAVIGGELIARAGHERVPERGTLRAGDRAFLLEHIESNIAEPLRLGELAGLIGMNQAAFCRAFKMSLGQAPHQYLIRRRIDKAKRLIASSQLPLAEIAVMCGFASQTHLSDTFNRFVGHAPGRYRQLVAD
jgi:AraC family transcriptional regulator